MRAQQEHVAGHALDRPVLVHGADRGVVGIEHDLVVAELRDRAARAQRRQARAAPAAQPAVHLVAVQVGGAPALGRVEAVGQHREHGLEVRARELAVRPRLAHAREERVLAPVVAGAGRDDLLREDVERRLREHDLVEPAGVHRAQQRRALDQLVARGRQEPALRAQAERVTRAPDPLQRGRDAAHRADQADELDLADVDAELERRRGDQRPQLARLQPRLDLQPALARQAAVVRGDVLGADPLAEPVRQPLGQPARVGEDQGRAVRRGVAREHLDQIVPLLLRSDRGQVLARRHRDREVEIALVAEVEHRARPRLGARPGSARSARSAAASPTGRSARAASRRARRAARA